MKQFFHTSVPEAYWSQSMKRCLTILMVTLALGAWASPINATAADGSPVWTNLYNGTGNGDDGVAALAVDGSGNVYVTGPSIGQGTGYDLATIKYSGAAIPLWTNRFTGVGTNDDQSNALAVDDNGGVYVAGRAYFGSGSGYGYVILKYSTTGVPLWTNLFFGSGVDNAGATAMALDGTGNVYVTGYSYGTSSGPDYLTVKYSSAGVAMWTNRFNGAGNSTDEPSALAVDTSGNVIVTGLSTGIGGTYDYATIKYSTTGVALWTNLFNGTGNGQDAPNAVAIDGAGNVYVTGYSTGSGSGHDYATIKYSSAGTALWTNRYNGTGNNDDGANALAIDGGGNVYVAGASIGSGSFYDYVTIKYSTSGGGLWTNRFNGTGNNFDNAISLTLNGSNNVYVTGNSTSIGGNIDIVTLKYSTAGTTLWTNLFNGAANFGGNVTQIKSDGLANVYVAGGSYTPATDYNFLVVKYSGTAVSDMTPLMFSTTNGSLGFTNKQFVLTLTGPAGSNAVISASTDLQSWVPLITNQLTGGTLQFRDAFATNYPQRFYRATLR